MNWAVCNNSVCIQKRSLDIGAVIESIAHVELCYLRAFINDTNVIKCAPGHYLDSSHVREFEDDTCKYHRLGGNREGRDYSLKSLSRCGYSQNGYSFCDVHEGDEVFTKSLEIVKEFWKEKPNCHIDAPYGCLSARNKAGFWTVQAVQYEYRHFRFL